MKNFFKILSIVLVFGIFFYFYRNNISNNFFPIFDKILSKISREYAPCSKPIIYTISTFDTQFGISKEDFLKALFDAETIWEKPFNKELFTYTKEDFSSDVLKINLVYDYRQQATNKLTSIGIEVKNNKSSYDTLKNKFDVTKTEYEKEKNIFNNMKDIFYEKQQLYEKEVNFWNKKGGAQEKEYKQLQSLRLELEIELKNLQIMQESLNKKAEEINVMVVVLNRLATSLNLSVDKYNTINVSRGESFEEGVYFSDGINKEIDIYEFSSREKLVRVFAHELGHALGLEHVNDEKAIMYELNQGDTESLTKADINALKIKCALN